MNNKKKLENPHYLDTREHVGYTIKIGYFTLTHRHKKCQGIVKQEYKKSPSKL